MILTKRHKIQKSFLSCDSFLLVLTIWYLWRRRRAKDCYYFLSKVNQLYANEPTVIHSRSYNSQYSSHRYKAQKVQQEKSMFLKDLLFSSYSPNIEGILSPSNFLNLPHSSLSPVYL